MNRVGSSQVRPVIMFSFMFAMLCTSCFAALAPRVAPNVGRDVAPPLFDFHVQPRQVIQGQVAGVSRRNDPRNFQNGQYIHSVATIGKPFAVSVHDRTGALKRRFFTYERVTAGVRVAVELGKKIMISSAPTEQTKIMKPKKKLVHPAKPPAKPRAGPPRTLGSDSGNILNRGGSVPLAPPSRPQVAKVLRVVVFDVMIQGNSCGSDGSPTRCQPSCGVREFTSILTDGSNSSNMFWSSVSRSRSGFSLDPSDAFSVTVPSVTDYKNIPPAVESSIGHKAGDLFVYLVPANFNRGDFGGSTAGIGQEGGNVVWYKICWGSVITHEIGHTFGLGHAGTLSNNQFVPYSDTSSVMSIASEGWSVGVMRGIGAPQMHSAKWLPAGSILDVTQDGTYSIPNSLSSNANGIVASRVRTWPANRPLWIEWREALNQDVDLANAKVKDLALAVNSRPDHFAPPGFLGNLLLRDLNPDSANDMTLLAVLAPGESVQVFGVTVTHTSTRYTFSVSGIGSASAIAFQARRPIIYRAAIDYGQIRSGDTLTQLKDYTVSDPQTFFVVENQNGIISAYPIASARMIPL